jgi:hypothetical protein
MIMPCALRVAETAGRLTCDEFWHATRVNGTSAHHTYGEFWHATSMKPLLTVVDRLLEPRTPSFGTVQACLAHNLTRAAGCLANLFHAKARTGTLRRHLIIVPARIARRSRRITLHLPLNWPQRDAFSELFTTTHAPPHTA